MQNRNENIYENYRVKGTTFHTKTNIKVQVIQEIVTISALSTKTLYIIVEVFEVHNKIFRQFD